MFYYYTINAILVTYLNIVERKTSEQYGHPEFPSSLVEGCCTWPGTNEHNMVCVLYILTIVCVYVYPDDYNISISLFYYY